MTDVAISERIVKGTVTLWGDCQPKGLLRERRCYTAPRNDIFLVKGGHAGSAQGKINAHTDLKEEGGFTSYS